MLLRRDGDHVLCIGQPAHAWVSGQLARAWGNERFGAVEPWEEVCLGAEQHDIGMTADDNAPTWNRATGLPHAFTELPRERHVAMWSRAADNLLPQCRYAALLVSMHGTALYDVLNVAPEHEALVAGYLEGQRALQASLPESLGADPALLARNQRLLWTWDALSLGLLLGWAPYEAKQVPTATEPITVALRARGERVQTLAPWPFSAERVTLHCEGRLLPAGGAPDEPALHALLAAAPWETLEIDLQAAERR